MWIVRLALRRPYTFAVLALLIAILGAITIARTPTDIFPNINIPVVSVHLDLQRPVGAGDGGTHRHHLRARHDDDRQQHRAHRVAVAQRLRHRRRRDPRLLPARREHRRRGGRDDGHQPDRCCASCRPGTTPPFIIRYSATNVPILQLALQSPTLERAAALRLRPELHPHAARDGAGRAGAAALGREDAADHGRPRPRPRSTPRACRRSTSRPRSTRRTSSCRPAPRRWGRPSTTSAPTRLPTSSTR